MNISGKMGRTFFIILLLSLFSYLTAQTDAADLINDESGNEEEPNYVISAPEVIPRAEIDQETLATIKADIGEGPDLKEDEEAISRFNKKIQSLYNETIKKEKLSLSINHNESLRIYWSSLHGQIGIYKDKIEDRLLWLDSQKENLENIKTIWIQTRKFAISEAYTNTLMTQINKVLSTVRSIERQLAKRQQKYFRMQSKVSSVSVKIEYAINRIDDNINKIKKDLLQPEAIPIWEALASLDMDVLLSNQIKSTLETEYSRIVEFFETALPKVIIHFLFILVLIAFIFSIRKRIRTIPEDDEHPITVSLKFFDRPVSVGLLLGLALSALFYPYAPAAFLNLIRLILMIALLRVLPTIMDLNINRLIFPLAIVYLIYWFYIVFQSASLAVGILHFFLPLGLIWVLLSWLKFVRKNFKDHSGKLFVLAVFLSRFGIVLSVAVVLANIFGFAALSELLINGLIGSIYSAIAIFVILSILNNTLSVALNSKRARSHKFIDQNAEEIESRMKRILEFISIFYWIYILFKSFTVKDFFIDLISSVFSAGISFGNIELTVGDIAAFIFTIWLSIWISRAIRFFLEEEVLPRFRLPRGVPASISQMTHYSIVALGFFIALSAIGFDLGKMSLLIGALGVGIGFGLQDLVNNFISGLVLIFERPIKIGDTIEMTDLHGTVKKIGIRASIVRSWEGAEIIVPNGNLISAKVINWTLSDRNRRIDVTVGVSYSTDPKRVPDILLTTLKKMETVMPKPEPVVLFSGFGDSSLDFILRFWTTRNQDWMLLKSQVTFAVHQALKKSDIEIPFPQNDLHFRTVDPAFKQIFDAKKPPVKGKKPGSDKK